MRDFKTFLGPKLKAATVHFLFSAALVTVVLLLCSIFWFPGALFWAAGMATLMVLIVAVDLVLGPLLTAVVYQRGKRTLRFDLAVIASIQLAALFYGVYALYGARPAYIVFTMDRFEAVAALDIEVERPEFLASDFNRVPLTGPELVAARMPADKVERYKITMAKVTTGIGLAAMTEHYVPAVDKEILSNIKNAKDISDLGKFNDPDRVKAVLSQTTVPAQNLSYFPLVAKDSDLTVLIDNKTGSIVEIVDLRPWS